MHLKVRTATESDIPQIYSIFTHYVRNTVITLFANTPPFSYMTKRFHKTQERGLPFLVAVEQLEQDDTCHGGNMAEKVCGYTLASPFRGYMLSYAPTVEMSLFVHPEYHSRGIGSTLLSSLIEALQEAKHLSYQVTGHAGSEARVHAEAKVKSILAIMTVNPEGKNGGEGLRDWYVQRGFVERGRMKEVGFKYGKWIDTIYLQYTL
ncbi:GNAT family N-acetyltransferase, variant 1 [Blastomyces gilchristii SLH14081]|uniref:GNAT family N-acetyltransferase n=2 Tax=Blastomyces gilchristii (strain SLH14081) TaxID=559298 RepID=A0A179UUS6_BLAGS|nr:GNAT family N-acetyltransferase [Blastomyces gilchristii SLH14081]XP_031579517.1 GNAT family N-acetyltransferase, variant 1 [Blastomyces gilchristii SLH14081]OAT10801.1 GNAT family N-acetyltransferase [Blastomyces gilchristii SLH14081]OAT10802.1 GNAT family N-acetyltransferase, variant 1 [Blastomyces gilchristii SLH14081]